MNRLIIIGNGFDLAHGMKTKYYDFILWYLKAAFIKSNDQVYSDDLLQVTRNSSIQFRPDLDVIEDLKIFLDFLIDPSSRPITFLGENEEKHKKAYELRAKTDFIRNLLSDCSNSNWVDIEQQYYLEVTKLFKNNYGPGDLRKIIKHLNDTFESLKNKFQEYIKEQILSINITFHETPYFEELSKGIDYKNLPTLKKEEIQLIERLISRNQIRRIDQNEIIPKSTMILDFNYTSTIEKYLNNPLIRARLGYTPNITYIHGKANDEIIFGFGDEIDEHYAILEQQNNNEFLRHIKSFYYFKSHSLKDLIRFTESDIFEVFI